MEEKAEDTVIVDLVYNPFVLHLIYVKMRYLRRIVMRHYRRYAKIEDSPFLDYCILNDWYTEILTIDLDLMQSTMEKEAFPLPLQCCHYEYYLFRLSYLLNTPGEPYDELYTGSRFECETSALKVMDLDHYRMQVQKLLHEYLVTYYFDVNSAKKTERRIELLFCVKHTLEKEIGENMIDQENMQFFVEYDKELCITLFYIHLVDEMLSLYERQSTVLNHEPAVNKFNFVKRKLHKEGAVLHYLRKTDEGDMTVCILNKFLLSLCQTFRHQVPYRIKYFNKPQKQQEGATSWFSSSTTTTSPQLESEAKIKKKATMLNHIYLLDRPHEECFLVKKKRSIGRSSFYDNNKDSGKASFVTCAVRYIPYCSENRIHYKQFLYLIVFELFLREKHQCPSFNSACYLCGYFTRSETNKKMASLLTLFEEQTEEPGGQPGRFECINNELERLHIERVPPITLCSYKTLANVFCLFECFPLLYDEKEACHSLLSVINPLEMLVSLSSTIILCKLEAKMCQIMKLCRVKVIGHEEEEEEEELVVREHALAMDIELVRLINEAVMSQHNEIRRYERSIATTKVGMLESASLSSEIGKVLEKIYIAHIDILCQLMAERRQCVRLV